MVKIDSIRGSDNAIILDEMLSCNVACAGNFKRTIHLYEEDLIDWLYQNLPAIEYVVQHIVNFIFSNGLTTGDPDQDEKLNDFLYAKNIQGATNYSVLQESIRDTIVYGKSGLRFLSVEHGWINIKSKNYAALVAENKEFYGFKNVLGYLVSFDDVKMTDIELENIDFDVDALEKQGIIVDTVRRVLVLSKSEFVSIRNVPTTEQAVSPLVMDQQRLKLLVMLYERLNYDLEYDGPGRLVVRLKDSYAKGDDNDIGTSDILDQSTKGKRSRREKAIQESEELARKLKNSHSDSVIAMSNVFDEKFTHLPRVIKSTDFLDKLEDEEEIIAQIFSIPPVLLSLGDISGNVSMEKIIDNAMLNSIIPKREKYAVQFSPLLCEKLGLEKVYFNKYELKQVIDDNSKRKDIVEMIKVLVETGEVEIAKKMAKMLDADITTETGEVVKLSITDKIRKKFGGNKK